MRKEIGWIIMLFAALQAQAQLKRRVEPAKAKSTAPKVIYRDKAVEKFSEPVSSRNNLILKIVSDARCTIYVDGESRGIAEAGVAKKIAFSPGDYILRWVSTERKEAEGEERLAYTKDDMGAQKLFEVKLSGQVDAIKEEEERTLANKPLLEKVKKEEPQILAGIWDNMVLVEGGSFEMGCTLEQSACEEGEKPAHGVTLSNFYIGRYEVTQAQWAAVMGSNPSSFSGCAQCPVEQVSWDDVQEFLQKLNGKTGKSFRLPTEAEWEYAARGGNKSRQTQYAGSNNLDDIAWYYKNCGDIQLFGEHLFGEEDWEKLERNNCKTHPVGQKKANELDLFDMCGNVLEWCADWGGNYSTFHQTNPQGPQIGGYHILRGGAWYDNAHDCRVTYRTGNSEGGNGYGLRLVISSK
jgi:formylglycine-generating enzyme required for sulfatase activity